LANRSRRSWILLAPAVALTGLGALVAGRVWLTPPPGLPAFARDAEPRFQPVPALADRPPGGAVLQGLVLDPDGAPVADVLVYARPAGVPTWDLTDPAGHFELPWPLGDLASSPQPEAVPLAVAAWGFPTLSLPVSWQADPIEVRLPPPEEPTPSLPGVETSTLVGRVLPARESRAEGGGHQVVLTPIEAPDEFGGSVTRRVQVDAGGRFQLEDLAHGRYRVSVLPGWAAGGSWPDLVAPGSAELTHPREGGAELDLALIDSTLRGSARDAAGAPLEGAFVILSDAERPERLWPPQLTDAGGRFLIADLPPGTYRLLVSAGEGRVEEPALVLGAGEDREVLLPPLALRDER
jgi:hypothetical protein